MIYAMLAEGRDEAGMMELDSVLAGTLEEKEAIRERANARAMEQFKGQMAGMQIGRPR